MAKHYADVRINLTVMFDDEGEEDLQALAIDAALDQVRYAELDGIEVIGPIRDKE